MIITIIGIGLIGGSMAKMLRHHRFAKKIIGVENNAKHAKQALVIDLVDEILPLEEAIIESDLILLATPVHIATELAKKILDKLTDKQTLFDVGSTKQNICEAVATHPKRGRFVATHPMAGTEYTGPLAALKDLFTGKITVICQKNESAADALNCVRNLYRVLAMKIVYMEANSHDLHIAYVSHLSHVIAFTLGKTVLEIEKDEKAIFDMASTGFASTARLAKSSADMWVPIFEQNATNLSNALDAYIKNLQQIKILIDKKDAQSIHQLITKANDIKRVLDGIELSELPIC